ncbi:hypothetical protein LJR234_000844 [Mesorhizobium amorphae]|uniref:hypothetical protein n=1 Tax=Mesorhizobium amorphae TaxID=71433 RepID=UPI003ED16F6C
MTTVQEKLTITPAYNWFSWLARGFARHAAKRRAYIDIRELSPHLQRDMGFLDGNDPHRPYK